MCGNVWWCLVDGGSVRLRVVVCCRVWWCVIVYFKVWWCLVEGGSVRLRVVVCCGVWWQVVVGSSVWWMECSHVWLCGSVWCYMTVCHFQPALVMQ